MNRIDPIQLQCLFIWCLVAYLAIKQVYGI